MKRSRVSVLRNHFNKLQYSVWFIFCDYSVSFGIFLAFVVDTVIKHWDLALLKTSVSLFNPWTGLKI